MHHGAGSRPGRTQNTCQAVSPPTLPVLHAGKATHSGIHTLRLTTDLMSLLSVVCACRRTQRYVRNQPQEPWVQEAQLPAANQLIEGRLDVRQRLCVRAAHRRPALRRSCHVTACADTPEPCASCLLDGHSREQTASNACGYLSSPRQQGLRVSMHAACKPVNSVAKVRPDWQERHIRSLLSLQPRPAATTLGPRGGHTVLLQHVVQHLAVLQRRVCALPAHRRDSMRGVAHQHDLGAMQLRAPHPAAQQGAQSAQKPQEHRAFTPSRCAAQSVQTRRPLVCLRRDEGGQQRRDKPPRADTRPRLYQWNAACRAPGSAPLAGAADRRLHALLADGPPPLARDARHLLRDEALVVGGAAQLIKLCTHAGTSFS